MIEFQLEELSSLEDQLEQALHEIENAVDAEGDSSVNLLQVGMCLGKAMATIDAVTDVINRKVLAEKNRPLTKTEFDSKYLKKTSSSGCSPCQSQPKQPERILRELMYTPSPWEEDDRDDT